MQQSKYQSNKFQIGDKVHKPKGYRFNATIVAVFKNLAGNTRVVAENEDGILHIFNEEQLDKIIENSNM